MPRLLTLAATLAVLLTLLAGCETNNVGDLPFPGRGPVVTVTVPAGLQGISPATWTVTWLRSGWSPTG